MGYQKDDAAVAAEYYPAWRHAEHRGVEGYGHRIVVFGNDGGLDRAEVAEEVRLVREWIRGASLEEDGFASTEDGWVIVVRALGWDEHVEVAAGKLHKALHEAAVQAWGCLTGMSCSLTLHRGPCDLSPAQFAELKARQADEPAAATAAT